MSLDYIPRSKYSKSYLACANDIIIQEIKSLVKREKYVLESENDHLKKNNDELLNRIQELYAEFDISIQRFNVSQGTYLNTIDHLKHFDIKSQSAQKKKVKVLKTQTDQLNNFNDLRNQLASSQDSLSMIQIKSKENDSEFIIKDKEIEILENHNVVLKKKIKEIENYNKDLQKECKTMAKSMKNSQKTFEKPIPIQHHKDIGLAISMEDKMDAISPARNSDLKSTEHIFPSLSPTYIDIFDNRPEANIFSAERSIHIKNTVSQKIIPENEIPSNSFKKVHKDREISSSPIYADVWDIKTHKFTSTDSGADNICKAEDNKKRTSTDMKETYIKFSNDIEGRFMKLSNDHELLNEKLDIFRSTGLKNLSSTLADDGKDTLLKKTSEDVIKISEEQQQIMNILQKNSKTLEELQELKNENVNFDSHCQNRDHLTTCNEIVAGKIKNMKNISCQTDLVFKDDDRRTKIKSSLMEENYDLFKVINNQNNKIQDLLNKFTTIPSTNTCLDQAILPNHFKPSMNFVAMENQDIYGAINIENFVEESERSLENISNLSDIIDSFSDKAVANFLEKDDQNKSVTSIRLSTSESQDTLNSERSITKNDKREEGCTNMVKLNNFEELLLNQANKNKNEHTMAKPVKFTSKIPKLLTSKSLDFVENQSINNGRKGYSNDLESSYETLYDPVLSSRNEDDNATPI